MRNISFRYFCLLVLAVLLSTTYSVEARAARRPSTHTTHSPHTTHPPSNTSGGSTQSALVEKSGSSQAQTDRTEVEQNTGSL